MPPRVGQRAIAAPVKVGRRRANQDLAQARRGLSPYTPANSASHQEATAHFREAILAQRPLAHPRRKRPSRGINGVSLVAGSAFLSWSDIIALVTLCGPQLTLDPRLRRYPSASG